MDQYNDNETAQDRPRRPQGPPSLELPQLDGRKLTPRASRALASLVRLHRITGRRPLRVVIDPETVAELEPFCTRNPQGHPALGGWELVAAPDAGSDQITLYDIDGRWVLGAFTPHYDVGEPGMRVYEGLRRAGYSVPEALDLSAELGPPLEPGSSAGPFRSDPTPGGPTGGSPAAPAGTTVTADPATADFDDEASRRGFLRR